MQKFQNSKVHYTADQVGLWLDKRFPEINWDDVKSELPPIVWRHRWDTLADRLGLPYSRGYMQNLDCIGQGPASVQVEA